MATNDSGQSAQEAGTTSQAGPGAQQNGQENGGTGQEPGSQGNTGTTQFDPTTIADVATRTYVEKVAKDAQEARQEAARYRTERNTFQTQAQQAQQANETAEQTAQRERETEKAETERLRTENRDLKVGGTVRTAAEAAQAFNPTTVYGLIKGDIQVDDQGKATNVAALITALKASDPYLFKRTSADAGAGQHTGGSPSSDMNAQIRTLAGRGTIQG